MSAAFDFVIEQNTDWSRTLTLQNTVTGVPTSLTGYTGVCTIYTPNGPTLIVLSSTNGLIAVSGTAMTLSIPAAQTVLLTPGYYAYLLTVTDNLGNVSDWLSGLLTVSAGISVISPGTETLQLFTPGSVIAATPFYFTVEAISPAGVVDVTYTGTVNITTSDPFATLPAPSTLSNGFGVFSGTLLGLGSQTLTVTDSATSTLTATSIPISVNAAGTFLKVQHPSQVTEGTGFGFTVTATNANKMTDTGFAGQVIFTTNISSTLPPESSLTSGVGFFSATLAATGIQVVMLARDSLNTGIVGYSYFDVASPGQRPLTYGIQVSSLTVTEGVGFVFALRALYADDFTTDTSYNGTVHFTSNDTAAILPANATLANGVGGFSLTFNTTGTRTFTATDTVTATITQSSPSITVVA